MIEKCDALLLAGLPLRIAAQVLPYAVLEDFGISLNGLPRLVRVKRSRKGVPLVKRAGRRVVGDAIQPLSWLDHAWTMFLGIIFGLFAESLIKGLLTGDRRKQRCRADGEAANGANGWMCHTCFLNGY